MKRVIKNTKDWVKANRGKTLVGLLLIACVLDLNSREENYVVE